jgi:hypothetical protein
MKRQVVSFAFGLLSSVVLAQNIVTDVQVYSPKISISISDGTNNFSGIIGIQAEASIIKNTTALVGIGIDSWGPKTSVGVRYYKNYPKGIYFGLSFSSLFAWNSSGAYTTSTSDPNNSQEIDYIEKNVQTINPTIGYNWNLGKRMRFYLELGYSIPLQVRPYTVTYHKYPLTESDQLTLDSMTPGGFVTGWGFTIGF